MSIVEELDLSGQLEALMYGVIRRYKYDPKWNTEVNRKVYEIFVPLLRKVPGFIAYYWLNTDDGGPRSAFSLTRREGTHPSAPQPTSSNVK